MWLLKASTLRVILMEIWLLRGDLLCHINIQKPLWNATQILPCWQHISSISVWKQRSRNYRYSLQYRLSKLHIGLSALWVIAGGRGITSAPNLSWRCYKLTFRCWVFLSARRAAADVITPSHPLQPAGECQRPSESPWLTSQTFYLTFFFIQEEGVMIFFGILLLVGACLSWQNTMALLKTIFPVEVPLTGSYKSLLAPLSPSAVMFRYIPPWHLEAEGSVQEGKSLNKQGRCPGGSAAQGPHPLCYAWRWGKKSRVPSGLLFRQTICEIVQILKQSVVISEDGAQGCCLFLWQSTAVSVI